ncbi:hypothetical protein WR25_08449 [Diploscapter pachys]|uniref:Uncharacterized protein n=1 Tax=Diploscapter pachys TaxID=2018661 RepID=A0A2A2M2U0_9BILA|nr:hypothetical protein WR25_08449 [Diploscapter pachys]
MVVMMRAERLFGLLDQPLVRVDLLGRRGEFLGIVREDVEVHALRQRPRLAVAAGEQRRIDQDLVIRLVVDIGRTVRLGRHRARRGPAGRELHRHLDRDLTGEIARGIQADRVGFEADHVGRRDDAALIGLGGRDELELDVQIARALRHVDVEGEDVDHVARPRNDAAVRLDDEAGQLFDLTARAMRAGQPLGEQQRHRPRLGDGNRLLHAEDALFGVGRIDVEQDRAGIGRVLRRRDRVDEGHRLRCRIAGRDLCKGRRGGGQEQGGDGDGTEHGEPSARNEYAGFPPPPPSTLMVKAITPRLKTKAARHWPSTTRRMRREVMETSLVWNVMPSVALKYRKSQ